MSKPNIIKLQKQGFCYGVKRALKIVLDAVQDETIKKPIYLLGNLVHNFHIDDLLKEGLDCELLNMVVPFSILIFNSQYVKI